MIKRIVCLLAAVMVTASSVFAWDAYSFTGVADRDLGILPNPVSVDSSNSVNLFDPSVSWPSSGSSIVSVNGSYHLPAGSYDGVLPVNLTGPLRYWTSNIPYYRFSGKTDYASSSVFFADSIQIPYSHVTSFRYEFSSPFPTSISIDGLIRPRLWVINFDGTYLPESQSTSFATSVYVSINDGPLIRFMQTSGGAVSISDIFTDYNGIRSIAFYPDFVGVEYIRDVPKNSDVTFEYDVTLSSPGYDKLLLGVLSDTGALDGQISGAQGNLNDLDGIESQWAGAMSENFGKLDLGNFTFPSGLVSGFALMSGIFQDLWNSMGEYKILYVFPLFLGIALLLIGRISKFSGGQSSTTKNRGDSDA